MKTSPLHLASLLSLCLTMACGPIVVRVGSREKPRPEFKPQASRDQAANPDAWFDDYNEFHEDQARVLIRKLQEGLRRQLRSALADAEHVLIQPINIEFDPKAIPSQLEDLEERNPIELKFESQILPWRAFLQAKKLLIKLDDSQSFKKQSLDPAIVGIFFDFGINVRGFSQFASQSGRRIKATEIYWQLIPEQTDQDPYRLNPNSLRMRIIEVEAPRGQKSPDMQIEFLIGPGLYEGRHSDNLPYHSLQVQLTRQELANQSGQTRLAVWQGKKQGYSEDLDLLRGQVITLRYYPEQWLSEEFDSVLGELLIEIFEGSKQQAHEYHYSLLTQEGWQFVQDESLLDLAP